jgi:plastocyanin
VRKLRRVGIHMCMIHFKASRLFSSAYRRRHATHFSLCTLTIATWFTLASLGQKPATAADISVAVFDRDGHGIADVAVTVTAANSGVVLSGGTKTAVMDQRNLAFMPRVLVVAVGTGVEFPNNDTVNHQVYSFSAAKRFQLPLYKGQAHSPITFDRPGLVVLGCNIHDVMVGYIYVTDAMYFGKTGSGGGFDVKNARDGEYRIEIWSPYITDPAAALSRTIRIGANEPATIRVQLNKKLRAEPEPKPRRRDWEY